MQPIEPAESPRLQITEGGGFELTQKIAKAVFPNRDQVMPSPVPESLGGKVWWAGEFFVNWFMLVLALVNLVAALFDCSYLEMRPTYMHYAPQVVSLYDPVKGIEPHHTTDGFVKAADAAFASLHQQPNGPEAAAVLANMRTQATTMVQEDPFAGAGMSGVFEQLKNRVRKHMRLSSAKQALAAFWTPENLTPERLDAEQTWFERQARPLIARNYFRRLGENGLPFDAFWRIDFLFIPLFVFEFLIRGTASIRKGLYPSWKAFCLDRWYDLIYLAPLPAYFMPFVQGPFQLVRVIPVSYRMQRLGLINPMAIAERQSATFTNLITDVVNVKLLTNYQDSISKIDLAASLNSLTPKQRAEVIAFIDQNMTMMVTRVLPALTPELEALLTRAVGQALDGSPAFHNLKKVPMVGSLVEHLLPSLVKEVLAGTQASLAKAMTDQESRKLTEAAIEKFSVTLLEAMAESGTERDIKKLVIDLLEEQKRKLLV